jgi:putative flippase GtrA
VAEPGVGLRRRPLLPPTLVGFAIINLGTFGLDLALLTLLHGGLGVTLPIAFTVAYVTAFATSYALNRRFNFRSHAPVGRQLAIYAVAVAINYLAFILGVATGLAALGVEYHLARIAAGLCEGVYMYCVLRWIVFRR